LRTSFEIRIGIVEEAISKIDKKAELPIRKALQLQRMLDDLCTKNTTGPQAAFYADVVAAYCNSALSAKR
jgi:hypothetical protein